jgi:beta-glucanase (GH16 family)
MRTIRIRRTLAAAASVILVASLAIVVAPPAAYAQQCPDFKLCVDAPDYRATISGNTTIEFNAPGMKNIWGRAWHQPDASQPDANGYENWFSNVDPLPADGHGTLTFPADQFPHGPITVMISAWNTDATREDHAYLQLYNAGGVNWNQGLPSAPAQAAGMNVAFQDDFTGPLSISKCGTGGATYNSYKADGSEYGDAIFAHSEDATNPFANLDNQYLRIRASKAPPGTVDPRGWNRTHFGGNITSLRCDGTGVAAAMGYFEARILAPSATGTWPAFWFLSKDHIAPGTPDEAEIDTFEGYGHDNRNNYICRGYAHWGSDPHIGGGQCFFDKQDFLSEDDFARHFHVYGMQVTQNDIIYYVDNREVWRSPTFDKARGPMYFLISMALGGGWPIDLSRYGDAVDMYVDWVRVYEPGTGGGTGTDLARNRPVTASSEESDNTNAASAVDGNPATRWASGHSMEPYWIQVDLGSSRAINRVRLNWESAYAPTYQVQVSADGSSWATVHATTTGDGGVDDLTVSGTGRYVRVSAPTGGPHNLISLWDFEVY